MKTEIKINNFVAKHAQTSGAGLHETKRGKRAKRARQKRSWKTLIHKELS